MTAKEKGLTGLAIVLLAFWELMISEIPLGLFSIRQEEHVVTFDAILLGEILLASILISRAILQHYRARQLTLSHGHCQKGSAIPPVITK